MDIDLTPRTLPAVLRRMRTRITSIERELIRGVRLPGRMSPGGATVTDWNTVTASGFYGGAGAANAPGSGQLVGLVESDGDKVVQRVFNADLSREYVRQSEDGGATWTEWGFAMSRHIQDNFTNGRAYVGTGSTATNQNGTYIGMSPVGGLDEGNANAFWFQTNGLQVFSIGKDGSFGSPMMPSRMASGTFTLSGTISSGDYVDTTVTLPTGRFTSTPRVSLTMVGSGSVRGSVAAMSVSTTSMNVRVFNGTTGGSVSAGSQVNWTATQD